MGIWRRSRSRIYKRFLMRATKQTSQFKRDLKRESRGPHRKSLQEDFVALIAALAADQVLDQKYLDHPLSGDWMALRITKISRLENGIFPLLRRFQAIFTHYPYFICVFSVFLAFFVGFGRIDPYLATDCCIKQVNRRML